MNKPLDTQLFDKALKFATDAHSGTERREKGFPYIIHPMEAVTIVATITSDPELLAAAILHDTVEDTDVTFEDIRKEFGERVATLVQHETAQLPGNAPWRARKQSQADLLASAPRDSKIVAIGDKLSNLRAIASDFKQIGDELWKRFSAPNGMEDVAWYYRKLSVALSDLDGTLPYQEFLKLLEETFGPERETL